MTRREVQLQAQVSQLEAELASARQEIRLLRQKINLLARKIFGCSSENLSPDQLQLLLALAGEPETLTIKEPVAPEPVVVPWPRAKRERKPRLPEHLPVVEEVIDPEPVKAQPEARRCIGQEVTEQLDYEPARFLRRRTIRRTFVHRTDKDRAPLTAPLTPCLQERCLAAPGLLAQVVVSKYADHLPLYRQEHIFRQRHGVELSRQALAGWIDLVADWLQPIYGHLRAEVFQQGYVQIDETPVRYLAPGHGQTKQGCFWAHRPGGEVIYHWETSRGAACLENVLPVDFKGTVQCDGYSAYDALARRRAGAITLADCWAHVRRKFFEAKESAPRTAGWILRQIQHLYRIEQRLREQRRSPKLREAFRAQESRMLVGRIGQACERLQRAGRHLPQSPLGKALSYTWNQWAGLQVFVADGRVEIDNNLVENAIRPTAVGKKNWLFIGAEDAGQHSAVLFTIIENCRRLEVNPYDYLRDVLTRLPTMTNQQTHTVTPQAWAREQAQAKAKSPALKLASSMS